jgi:hypothetical protein
LLAPAFFIAWLGWEKFYAAVPRLATVFLGLCFFQQLTSVVAPDSIEYIQNDEAKLPRSELLTGFSTGQWGRRLSNTRLWLQGKTTGSASIAWMEKQYVPNLWGFSWAKRMQGMAQVFFLGLWCLCGVAALLCFWKALKTEFDFFHFWETPI